jgi:hypothetical protein
MVLRRGYPSQFEDHGIIRIGTSYPRLVRVFLPGEHAAELQRLREGEYGIESPGAHARRRFYRVDEKLVTDLVAGLAGAMLRYDPGDNLRHVTYARPVV